MCVCVCVCVYTYIYKPTFPVPSCIWSWVCEEAVEPGAPHSGLTRGRRQVKGGETWEGLHPARARVVEDETLMRFPTLQIFIMLIVILKSSSSSCMFCITCRWSFFSTRPSVFFLFFFVESQTIPWSANIGFSQVSQCYTHYTLADDAFARVVHQRAMRILFFNCKMSSSVQVVFTFQP